MSETMTLDTVRDILLQWLKEIATRHGSLKEHVRAASTPAAPGSLHYIFCTDNYTYHLHATPTYLGCGAKSRRTRAGEDWHRGNDLPDGPFNRDTWEAIKDACLSYELVKLEPAYEPMGSEPSGVPEKAPGRLCPSCGVGIDDDGDGNCALCGGKGTPAPWAKQPEAKDAVAAEPESAFDEGAAAGMPV